MLFHLQVDFYVALDELVLSLVLPLVVIGEELVTLNRLILLGHIKDELNLLIAHLALFYPNASEFRNLVHDGEICISNVNTLFAFRLQEQVHLELEGRLLLLHHILVECVTINVVEPKIRIWIDSRLFSPRLSFFPLFVLAFISTLSLIVPSPIAL